MGDPANEEVVAKFWSAAKSVLIFILILGCIIAAAAYIYRDSCRTRAVVETRHPVVHSRPAPRRRESTCEDIYRN